MTLAELRAKMAAKQTEIRAKMAELNTSPAERHAEIETQHAALVAEYDGLARREVMMVADEARQAHLDGHSRAAAQAASATAATGAAGAEGGAAAAALTASQGFTLVEEGRSYGLPEADVRGMVSAAQATEASVRDAILRAAAERQRAATNAVSGTGATITTDERQKVRDAVENALLHRYKPSANSLTEAGRQFRGMTLIEIGRDMLERQGVSTRGLDRNEVATRSLMSTSDFPLTLANITNRTLRDAYQASPRTFMPIARQITLSDFKAAHRVKIGDAPQLLEVLENGEFKRGAMNEGDETIKLRTYGRVVGITRQVIINDDLGAFTRVPEMFGVQAANLESNVVWGMILSNPTLFTDNVALFHAKHNNLGTGVNSSLIQGNPPVPTPAAIAAARIFMAKQVGDGDGAAPLNIRPKFIVVPPELEIAIQQILFGIVPNAVGAVVPEAIKSLTPISEPRLSTGVNGIAGSATGWYLFADPSTIDTIEYAYLEGQAGPYTESRNGFDVDGVEVKCRHDFGAAAIDYRGVYKAAGA